MYEDIVYNLGYLDTALFLKDSKVLSTYAAWIYKLLCHLMKDISHDRIKSQMVTHYELLKSSVVSVLDKENADMAALFLDAAIDATNNCVFDDEVSEDFRDEKFGDIKTGYLGLLLSNKSRDAIEFITNSGSTIPLVNLYLIPPKMTMRRLNKHV